MRRHVTARSLALIALLSSAVAAPTAAETVNEILAAGQLKSAYNPVLLDYLLEEGKSTLPEKQHKQALDQLVTALKQETTITKEEQQAAALASAAALLAEAFGGGGLASEMGSAASDATHDIYSDWIDAGFTLLKAGYGDDANAFFEHCMTAIPYPDLQGRCALGLAKANPERAIELLIEASNGHSEGAIKSALWALGGLAASEELSQEQSGQILEHIQSFASGLKKASYGRAACEAMVRSGDPRVTERLKELKGGMMNQDISPCALRGLLLTFEDQSVVPDLEKKLKGGFMDTTKPPEKLFAARTLMQAGHDSGFEWTKRYLTGKKKQKDWDKATKQLQEKGKKSKWKKPDEGDMRNAVVNTLVTVGDERGVEPLKLGFAFAKQGSWIETWIALGLYRLGDDEHGELLRQALESREWDFTTLRIAESFAANGDYSGIGPLTKLYDEALARAAKTRKDDERAKLRRLRSQIASTLAGIDKPECAAQLKTILGDPDPLVAASAAYGLARMSEPSAAAGLEQALTIDYGKTRSGPRSPVVHAHVARAGASKQLEAVIAKAATSAHTSVKFLGLCASQAD